MNKKKVIIAGAFIFLMLVVLAPHFLAIVRLEIARSVCDSRLCEVVPVPKIISTNKSPSDEKLQFFNVHFSVPEGGVVDPAKKEQLVVRYGEKKMVSIVNLNKELPPELAYFSVYTVTKDDVSYFSSLEEKKRVTALLLLKSVMLVSPEVFEIKTDDFTAYETVSNEKVVSIDIDITDSNDDVSLFFVGFSEEERNAVLSSLYVE